MPEFCVDTGKLRIWTYADDAEGAIALVSSFENCPRSCCSIVKPRFNPFRAVNAKHGAPMGRHGDDSATYDGVAKLYARHCGGDGCYDRGGAYWGHSKVCAVWTRGGRWCAYVEAFTPETAIQLVRKLAEG